MPDRWFPGFLSSLSRGGGPTLRTVVKALAMAVSKGRCGKVDIVAVVTAATCFVNRGSSCQKGWEDGVDSSTGGAGGVGTGVEARPVLQLRWWPRLEEGLGLHDSEAALVSLVFPSVIICFPRRLSLSSSDSQ